MVGEMIDAKTLGATDAVHTRRMALLASTSPDVWERPMDLGGSSRSHHSSDLGYLVKRRLVEKRPRASGYTRPSWLYRRTMAGTHYLRAHE